VSAILLYGTTESADVFHALPVHVLDPFPYLESGERRLAVLPRSDAEKLEALGVEVVDPAQLGRDTLLSDGVPDWEVDLRMADLLCAHAGVDEVTVPAELPMGVGERLRAAGVTVTVDPELFFARRRVKTPTQLEGIRRAQAAADAAMSLAAVMIREHRPGLTSEQVRARLQELCDEHGCDLPDDVIVAGGAQGAVGHEPGHGELVEGEAVIVDLWPRDRASGCWADMTRTFIAGGVDPHPDIARWHRLSRESLELVLAEIRPGASARALYERSCEPFHRDGHPTQLTKQPGEVLTDGYWWALGHGVGLEVHERPYLGRSTDVLVEGDVLALEPGCARAGFGSARLEDLVLVTADGAEVLTRFPHDL
jgi:Xaa-Pro aminopeptidase